MNRNQLAEALHAARYSDGKARRKLSELQTWQVDIIYRQADAVLELFEQDG